MPAALTIFVACVFTPAVQDEWRLFESTVDVQSPSIAIYDVDHIFYLETDDVEMDGVVSPGLGVELHFGDGETFLPFSLFAEGTGGDFEDANVDYDLLQIRTGLRYRAVSYRTYDEETRDVNLEVFGDLALGAAWFRIDHDTEASGFLELRGGLRGDIFRGVALYFAVGGEGHVGAARGWAVGGLAGIQFDF